MRRPARLIPCPACSCHIRATEARCPLCDAVVHQKDGSIPRTAAAVLLGLSTAVAGCGDVAAPVYGTAGAGGTGGNVNTGGETSQPVYGTSATGGTGGMTGGTGGMTGGTGGMTGGGGAGGATGGGGSGGTGGDTSQPVYGAPPMK